MRILLFSLIISISAVYLSCKSIHKNEISHTGNKSPEVIGKMIITDLLSKPDIWIAETDEYTSVHYAEACTGFGAALFAGILKDSVTIQRLSNRYLKILHEGPVNSGNHVDANVYGILPLEIYMQNKNEEFLKQGLKLADMQWENPLPNGLTNQTRYWIDDVWMIGSLQVQAYRATGNNKYLERAALEIDSYVQKLQQPNGLFRHGEESPFFWGRGNGWVAAGLAELLSELPESDQHYKSIAGGYKKMMDALVRYQSNSGMWRQLIDKEEAWEETSSTAMFGYALAVGVKIKILPENRYAPVYQKAWMALTKHINDEGKMTDVCVGTGQSDNKEYYLSRPRITGDMHGQAPMIWFASVLLDKK